MTINLHRGRALTVTALAFTLLGTAEMASATSLTYDFTQTGFNDGGTLTGTFSGTPDGTGTIAAAGLTNFQAVFHDTVNGTPNSFIFNTPNDFSYSAANGLSFSAGSVAEDIVVCEGSQDVNSICYGFTSPLSPRSAANAFFEDLPDFPSATTRSGPVVTQVGSASTTAPEPGSCALFASAGLLLVAMGRLKKGWLR